MNFPTSGKLEKFYRFFESYGNERLNGLDESYFAGLSQQEKEEAWDFLENGFASSFERIKGLYVLDQSRAISLFKEAIAFPIEKSPYASTREQLESSRLLMLGYIANAESTKSYINAMAEFSTSEFAKIRGQFAQSLPIEETTHEAVEALRKIIFTEVERIPLTFAITKFMALHGMDFEMDDPVYKSIYMSLRSGDQKQKTLAMSRLESLHQPHYL